MLGNLLDDMVLFKLVITEVIFYVLRNYVYELKLYLQEDMSVVWVL